MGVEWAWTSGADRGLSSIDQAHGGSIMLVIMTGKGLGIGRGREGVWGDGDGDGTRGWSLKMEEYSNPNLPASP